MMTDRCPPIGIVDGGAWSRVARHGIDMPVCTIVASLLHDGAGIDDMIRALLARPLKGEGE